MAAPSGIQRDPTADLRVRRTSGVLADIINSLMRSGQLEQTGVGTWQLTVAGAAVGANVARNSTDQTIADSTTTAISFDTEVNDDGGFWAVGQPTRLTIPTTGWYLMTCHIKYNSNSTGKRVLDFRFDGTTFPGASISWPGSSQDQDMALCLTYYLNANQYVEVTTFQNSGGGLDVTAAEAQIVRL